MPKIVNFITAVREALVARGNSTVQVLGAVNSALGEMDCVKETSRAGYVTATKKKAAVTDTIAKKYETALNDPAQFAAWHSALEKACKHGEIPAISLPSCFDEWLNAMKIKAEKRAPAETAEAKAAREKAELAMLT